VPANALAVDAEAIAAACHAMAGRFHLGGRLVVFGVGGSAADAAHVVVEFVHPVIVGKRALSAFALSGPGLAEQLRMLADPADIALGIASGAPDEEVTGALHAARLGGLLTIGLFGEPEVLCSAEHTLVVRSSDPLVVKEVQVTTYHVLWELVHVFLERPEVLS
jgi:D-sedoheptulose 7-phosphate isomerase